MIIRLISIVTKLLLRRTPKWALVKTKPLEDLWVNKPRKEKEVVLPLIRVFLFRLLGRMFSLVLGLCTRREFYHAAPRIPIKMIS